MATAERPVDLVVLSLEGWDDVWRRNQLLLAALVRSGAVGRVLFVEPPVDVLLELRTRHRLARAGAPRAPIEGVAVVGTTKVLPRALGPWADRSLRRQVRRAAAAAGLDDAVLWVNDPSFAGLAATWGGPVLYDVTDDWLDATAAPRERARLVANEDLLLQRADAVVVCSPELARRKASARPVVVPNAVDAERFRRPQPRPADLPPGPVAVYVGTLHADRLDVGLLEGLRAAAPEVAVALVGPDALGPAERRRLDAVGVARLGPRPHDAVPAYLQHADVLVVPHVRTPFTESLDPIKAYECQAVGRPTVATSVPGFLEGWAAVADDGAGFAAAVRAAVGRPSAEHRVPSWDDRAAEVRAVLRRISRP